MIRVLQTDIQNELLNDEMPELEGLIKSVIDHQKVHIDAIKYDKPQLQKLVTHLVEDNGVSKVRLEYLRGVLERTTEVKYNSPEFAQTRAAGIGQLTIQLSWIEQKLKDITDILTHNASHAKNSHDILTRLASPDASVHALKALLEQHKVHGQKPKEEAEKSITSAVGKLEHINTILGDIKYN